jgi:2-polyprenyl-6-methoxyphenol hydroxylase-like FAD-dependent oxidoreductase
MRCLSSPEQSDLRRAQGLNSGFRDAAALGWRLPLVLKGDMDTDRLLDTYTSEVRLAWHRI